MRVSGRVRDPAPAQPSSPLRATAWPLRHSRVVVADADALARCACFAARGQVDLADRLVGTGHGPLYVAPHVPEEVTRCLRSVAAAGPSPVPVDAAFAAWQGLQSRLRVVELPIGEYLRPEIAGIRRRWRAGADHDQSQLDGDPNDLGTAALAAFLGESVILSGDRVFSRHRFTGTLAWHQTGRQLLLAARIETSWEAGTMITVGTARATAAGTTALIRQIRIRPWVGLAIAGIAFLVWRYLPERYRLAARRAVGQLGRVASELAERAGASLETHRAAVDQLVVVTDPPWRNATDVELCARKLAKAGVALTAADLRDQIREELGDPRWSSAARIDRELAAHPAFRSCPGKRWVLGTALAAPEGSLGKAPKAQTESSARGPATLLMRSLATGQT